MVSYIFQDCFFLVCLFVLKNAFRILVMITLNLDCFRLNEQLKTNLQSTKVK